MDSAPSFLESEARMWSWWRRGSKSPL